MKTRIIQILILLAILLTLSLFQLNKTRTPHIIINNKPISLIIADTEAKREKGLGDRNSITDDYAMLFVFDKPDYYEFWMKDMKFPIDIVWLNTNKEIIYIKENISPNSYPNTFMSSSKAQYVMEFNAGFVTRNNIKVGNILNF